MALLLLMLAGATLAGSAARPPLSNAQLEERTAASGLPAALAELKGRPGPFWVGYAVASQGHGLSCCFDSRRGRPIHVGCRLEGDGSAAGWNGPAQPVALEARRQTSVLLRLVKGRVDEVRSYSADCALDAGGLPLVWLSGVAPTESLALLRSLAGEHEDEALSAIAEHADPGADTLLIELARGAKSPELRGEALFWLAQRASRAAVGEIQRAILEDPETQVKKQAVFALSELPADQGVPLLIDLARQHKNAAVREQAFFWLGESEDPRALAFFEEVLGRR